MSNDHYVAETYLKHFSDLREMLHVHSKKRGNSFCTKPNGICYEEDGDFISEFLPFPDMLGEYRAIFEPHWNEAIRSLPKPNGENKKAFSGYLANLLVCTPSWLRATKKISDAHMFHTLRRHYAVSEQSGKPDLKLKEMLDKLNSGTFFAETKEDFTRAVHAIHLLKYAWLIYNSDWVILENRTADLFITSDNPAAMEDPGPWGHYKRGFPRYFPLTPKYCLACDLSEKSNPYAEPEFWLPPQGTIRITVADDRSVKRVNKAVIQCAEDFVISSCKLTSSMVALITKYALYRVDTQINEGERDGKPFFEPTARARIPA
jgi:Protein of unknown function (DUF4238)